MDLFELAIAKFVNFGLMGGLVLHLEHEDDFVIEVGLVTYDLGLQRLHTLTSHRFPLLCINYQR